MAEGYVVPKSKDGAGSKASQEVTKDADRSDPEEVT